MTKLESNKQTTPKLIILGMMIGGLSGLTGCAANKPTYQSQRPNIVLNDRGVPNFYQVRRGDTVSKIAKRYGLNYRQVGRLNRLDNKYTIYSGQWIKLWEGSTTTKREPVNNPPKQNGKNNNYAPPKNISVKGYQYPTPNRVVQEYSLGRSDGMWFAGRQGDPVYASESGTVIYTGNGLPEFGNLVMIRHSDDMITAYAHNSQILVNESSFVSKGQKIATMGKTGNINQVALEFQVRRNGSPIDPRGVLNKR